MMASSALHLADIDVDLAAHEAETTTVHGIADTADLIAEGDARLTDARTPTAHAHAGEDITSGTVAEPRIASTIARDSEVTAAIAATKLDDLAAPDDNTDLNASTTKHGLLPKLSNVGTEFLNGQGAFSTPAGGGGGSVATDAIFDAKGDIPAGTGADTAARRSVGANDEVLIADSAQSTGLKYAKVANAQLDAAASIDYTKLAAVSGLSDAGRGRFDDLLLVERSGTRQKASVEDVFGYGAIGSARRRFSFYSDFTSGAPLSDGFFQVNGSGSGAALAAQGIAAVNRVGVFRAQTGTTTTGRLFYGTDSAALCLGNGAAVFEMAVNVTTLSDGTDTYSLLVGFADTFTTAPADAACFRYDSAGVGTGSAASLNWQCVTASNSSRTYTTTATVVTAGAWVTLRIEVNAAGTSVEFFIDGASVATHTTNIPTGTARALGYSFLLLKSAGTTTRTVDMDYLAVEVDFTTARPG